MLVLKRKTMLPLALAAVVALVGIGQPAFAQAAQAAQKNWKDRAEFDLYDSITKETTPAKRLELLNQWKEKYPTSEFTDTRMQVYVVTYQQLNKPAETIAAANELLAKDASNVTGLNAILTAIFTLPVPLAADAVSSAEKSANQVLSNIDTLFAADKKPQGVADADWTNAKKGVQLLAQNALGYIAWKQNNNQKAEDEFTKSLKLDPNQGQISYWLGIVVAAQLKPEKQSALLWNFARAAAYDGPNAYPDRPQAKTYLTAVYKKYHGSADGLDVLMNDAKASAFPPSPDWKVESKSDIALKEQKRQEEFNKNNPSLALWQSIKAALVGADGPAYFAKNMKGAALPGGANGVQKFVGKLIEAKPEGKVKELVLAIEDGKTPDVILKLDTPLGGKMEPGADIGFEGVASEYTATPFMVTFEVEHAKLTGWKGGPAPAAAKPAPHRPVTRKK